MTDFAAPGWNDIPARHWQGGPLDCSTCEHQDLLSQQACEPGRACLQDAYGSFNLLPATTLPPK